MYQKTVPKIFQYMNIFPFPVFLPAIFTPSVGASIAGLWLAINYNAPDVSPPPPECMNYNIRELGGNVHIWFDS